MASKTMKPSATSKVKELTPEELNLQKARFFLQKRESLMTGVLFNLVQGKGNVTSAEAIAMVDRASEMADLVIKKLYTVEGVKPE